MTDATNTDLGTDLNAEAATGPSLSYWQLVRKRFRRNTYGMAGLIVSVLIIVTAVAAGFIAPYGIDTKDRSAIYSPPQTIQFFAQEGGSRGPTCWASRR